MKEGYRMVPQLIARVDGLPVSLLERQVVWPAQDGGPGGWAVASAARADRAPDRGGAPVPAAGVGTVARRSAAGRRGAGRDPRRAGRRGAAVDARPSQPDRVGGD